MHYFDNITLRYEQTLEQFKCNVVEHMSLILQLNNNVPIEPLEIELTEAAGKYFSYILEHYTALKEIIVEEDEIGSFHATNVHNKTLQRLELLCCWIKPEMFSQLSGPIRYIEKIEFNRVNLLNNNSDNEDDDDYADNDDSDFIIDIPQTCFGEIAVYQNNGKEFFVKVYRSNPSVSHQATTHYYAIRQDMKFVINEQQYKELAFLRDFV